MAHPRKHSLTHFTAPDPRFSTGYFASAFRFSNAARAGFQT